MAIDKAGKKKWETQIPYLLGIGLADEGPLVVLADSSLVFSATSNLDTDVVRISAAGELLKSKRWAGRFLLVKPAEMKDERLQIFGALQPDTTRSIALMTIDKDLNETKRVTGRFASDYVARVVYRMPDRTLMLFGSAVHGAMYTSRAVRLDENLGGEEDFDFPRNQIDDEGTIWSAAPMEDLRGFLVPSRASARGLDPNHPEKRGVLPDFSRGAVLDLVRLQ